jgi:thioredoxin 1
MAIKTLQSKEAYEKAIENGLVLTDFNAPWCAPCRTQEPILEQLSTQYEGRVVISAMNVDENQDIAANLGIQSIPTMIIFKNSKEIQRFVGVQWRRFLMEKYPFQILPLFPAAR